MSRNSSPARIHKPEPPTNNMGDRTVCQHAFRSMFSTSASASASASSASAVLTFDAWCSMETELRHSVVRKQFRKLALVHHPDRGGDQEKFRLLNTHREQLISFDPSGSSSGSSSSSLSSANVFGEEICTVNADNAHVFWYPFSPSGGPWTFEYLRCFLDDGSMMDRIVTRVFGETYRPSAQTFRRWQRLFHHVQFHVTRGPSQPGFAYGRFLEEPAASQRVLLVAHPINLPCNILGCMRRSTDEKLWNQVFGDVRANVGVARACRKIGLNAVKNTSSASSMVERDLLYKRRTEILVGFLELEHVESDNKKNNSNKINNNTNIPKKSKKRGRDGDGNKRSRKKQRATGTTDDPICL